MVIFYGDTRPSWCSTDDPTSVEIKNHGPLGMMSSTKISLMSCPHRYPLYNLSTLHMCHYCEIIIRLAAVLSIR
jgi:hypothetical protein